MEIERKMMMLKETQREERDRKDKEDREKKKRQGGTREH